MFLAQHLLLCDAKSNGPDGEYDFSIEKLEESTQEPLKQYDHEFPANAPHMLETIYIARRKWMDYKNGNESGKSSTCVGVLSLTVFRCSGHCIHDS